MAPQTSDRVAGFEAMHLREIVEVVVSTLDPKDPCMVTLALVSKAWSEVVFEWRWHSLDTLVNLLRLLGDVQKTTLGWTLTRQLYNASWDRFNHYAKYVVEIFYSDRSDQNVSPELSMLLLSLRPQPVLLPRLKRLTLQGRWRYSGHLDVLPFIHPSLEFLDITLFHQRSTAFRALSVLGSLPNLNVQRFVFRIEQYSEDLYLVPPEESDISIAVESLASAVSSFISKQPRLLSLQLKCIGVALPLSHPKIAPHLERIQILLL